MYVHPIAKTILEMIESKAHWTRVLIMLNRAKRANNEAHNYYSGNTPPVGEDILSQARDYIDWEREKSICPWSR